MPANLPIGSTSSTSRPNGNWFATLAVATSRISGRPATFLLAVAVVVVWGHWAFVRLQRHLAARHQYWHDDRDLPNGLPDPGDAKPRHAGAATEARRADHGDQKCAEPHRRHRGRNGRRNRKSEDRNAATRRLRSDRNGIGTCATLSCLRLQQRR